MVVKLYMDNINNMKLDKTTYIDNNKYINLKTNNIIKNLLLKNSIKKHNKRFIEKEILKFNNDLSFEQKKSIVVNENNILLLSGAGCGKTYTIVSKIKYLIEEKNINEKEILCLSFTNKSTNDLKNKIKYNIDIFTFHKLSLELLNDYNFNYKVCPSDYLEYIVNEIFNGEEDKTKRIIVSFINLFIMNNKKINNLEKMSKKNLLLKVIKEIYVIYENEKESQGLLDFNDMILKSIELINKYGFKRYYKYIIIDEYQDISYSRYLLVKKIKESCNSYIFAVGDDYQSIYNFSGSNIKMVYNFKKLFGYTKILYLTRTYRNSNELVKLSNKFILKNRKQIKKKLYSSKQLNKPVKIIYYDKNLKIKFKKLISTLNNTLILLRNRNDINLIIDNDIKINNYTLFYENKEFNYLTVHKSKGLEEENIIILNLVNKANGFPSSIKSDSIIKYAYKECNKIEEERRLFYVALTRSKNYVFLFVDKNNPSIFVKEILKESKNYIEVLDL